MKPKIVFGLILSFGILVGFGQTADIITTNIDTLGSQSPTNKLIHFTDGLSTTGYVTFVSRINIDTAAAKGPAYIKFYDGDGLRPDVRYGPIGITNAFTNTVSGTNLVSVTRYATNYAVSNIVSSGITNWYTNRGIFTLYTTNQYWTNVLDPAYVIYIPYSATAATYEYDVSLLFGRGIIVQAGTNIILRLTGTRLGQY